jgi:hypothetical protein
LLLVLTQSNMTSLTRTRSQGYMPVIIFKTIVADRSGSMGSFSGKQYDMAEHLLQDAKNQATETQKSTVVTLVAFDNTANDIMRDRDLLTQDIPSRQEIVEGLTPRGCTRFNDTLIEEVKKLEEKKNEYLSSLAPSVRKLKPDVATVLIAITDGQDNESRSSKGRAREKMLSFRKNGGRAILMAANMDAEEVGGWYGFNPEKSITVHNSNEQAIESCYRAVSTMARNMSQGIDAPFTGLQRASSNMPTVVDNDNDDDSDLAQPRMPILRRSYNQPQLVSFSDTLLQPPLFRSRN